MFNCNPRIKEVSDRREETYENIMQELSKMDERQKLTG